MPIVFTNAAVRDLSEIWTYTQAHWSIRQANHYYRELVNAAKNLEKRPQLGKSYAEVWSDLRGLPAGSHLILYRILNNNVLEITRIVHQSMDIRRLSSP